MTNPKMFLMALLATELFKHNEECSSLNLS